MIQSCGMTAAAFTIFWMRVQLEWHSIIFCSLGGIVGMVIGLEFIDLYLTPPQKKIGFVCVWFSFAFALFLLNRYHKRKTYETIPDFKVWKLIVLLMTGFIGGIFSAISGSGVDICSFSILTSSLPHHREDGHTHLCRLNGRKHRCRFLLASGHATGNQL